MNEKYFYAGQGIFVKEDGKQFNRLITVPVHSEIKLKDGNGHFFNRKEPSWLNFETNNYGTGTALSLITHVKNQTIRFKVAMSVLNTITYYHDLIPNLTNTPNLMYKPYGYEEVIEKIVITPKMHYVLSNGLSKHTLSERNRIIKSKKDKMDEFFSRELTDIGELL